MCGPTVGESLLVFKRATVARSTGATALGAFTWGFQSTSYWALITGGVQIACVVTRSTRKNLRYWRNSDLIWFENGGDVKSMGGCERVSDIYTFGPIINMNENCMTTTLISWPVRRRTSLITKTLHDNKGDSVKSGIIHLPHAMVADTLFGTGIRRAGHHYESKSTILRAGWLHSPSAAFFPRCKLHPFGCREP